MRDEILRMENVSYYKKNLMKLENFNLNIYKGEIFGLVSINSYGLRSLIQLLKYNLPIKDGYIYYNENLINSRNNKSKASNKITLIYNGNSLVEGLTVADNIFVLREGFKKTIINNSVLQEQLKPFLKEFEIEIKAEQYIKSLTVFERIIVELLKGIVSGNKLIILIRLHSLLNNNELNIIKKIVTIYSKKGFTFIFLELHYEDICSFCDRIAFMSYGKIIKVFDKYEIENIKHIDIKNYSYNNNIENYQEIFKINSDSSFSLNFYPQNKINSFSIDLSDSKCSVIQCLDNNLYKIILKYLLLENNLHEFNLTLNGISQSILGNKKIGIIKEYCTQTMLFDKMSYLDNLCFNLDHRIKNVWLNNKIKNSIYNEYYKLLGKNVFSKNISDLSESQKIKLVYNRVLLQRPKILFCIQPFSGADNKLRLLIWEQLKNFIKNGIKVIIITANIADALNYCDRLIYIEEDRTIKYYSKSEFDSLYSKINN